MFDEFEPKPDRGDRLIRFVLGAVVGSGLGILHLRYLDRYVLDLWLIQVLLYGLVIGLLSAWRGDRFWKWLRDWIWLGADRP